MSNISFNKGDYNQQLALGDTQDGLIYLNPINRNITIGTNSGFVNFNELLVNNNTINDDTIDEYTDSSPYIVDTYIEKNRHDRYYYSVYDAEHIIGETSYNMDNGYISQKLSTLINGIPYEGSVSSNIQNNQNICTIQYPNEINKNFNIVIAFVYYSYGHSGAEVYTKIYQVTRQEDMVVRLDIDTSSAPNGIPYIYKAFWI